MSNATQAERITTVALGEQVVLEGRPLFTRPAQPACSEKYNGHWFCATHHESFNSDLQECGHIDRGKHRMAWICHTHGVEVP